MESKITKKRGRPSARAKIVNAALKLIKEIGVPALTLDAVAERAGVSKGGLLYHFPFKEELLTAANETIVDRLRDAREAEASRLPDEPGRALRAYVLASANNRAGNDEIASRMLTAGAALKNTTDPIRRYWQQRFDDLSADIGFDAAALVHVATEGLWFMEMLGLSPFAENERERVIAMILELIDNRSVPSRTPVEPLKRKRMPRSRK